MKYPQITYALLVEKNACKEQLALFEEHFGLVEPIPLTSEVVSQFGSLFDITWAARKLLTNEDCEEYWKVRSDAYAEYKKVRETAWEKYHKIYEPAWNEFYKSISSDALEEYKKVNVPAYAEYNKVRDNAEAEYNKVCALAFVEIYKKGLEKKS